MTVVANLTIAGILEDTKMFRGEILGIMYYSWSAYKKAWNEAVLAGKLI